MNAYFWNNRKHESYEELLNAICDCIYNREEIYEETYSLGYCKRRYPRKNVIGYEFKLISHYDLNTFFKKFRHNDNDGDWVTYPDRAVYKRELVYDENGKVKVISTFDYYQIIPPTFVQKQWIVIDSYNRVINSKDLRLDAINHDYDPNWKAKYRRQYNYPPPTSYRNGGWQKYLGNHAGSIGEYAKDLHHNDDKEAFRNEYGVTYKVRAKRTSELYRATDWDGGKSGWIEKGWKQTRKKKQWM